MNNTKIDCMKNTKLKKVRGKILLIILMLMVSVSILNVRTYAKYATDPKTAADDEIVNIPDDRLKARLNEVIGNILDTKRPMYADINVGEMRSMLTLWYHHPGQTSPLTFRGIEDLTGLEYARNLIAINIRKNKISDLSPLAGLENLKAIECSDNNITDISPLAGLTELNQIYLGYNNISDISALAKLTKLEKIGLDSNNITDISPLAKLTKIEKLDISGNEIKNLSVLENLTTLDTLYAMGCKISDVSPIAALTNLDKLLLSDNEITDMRPLKNLNVTSRLYNRQFKTVTPRNQNFSIPFDIYAKDGSKLEVNVGEGREKYIAKNPDGTFRILKKTDTNRIPGGLYAKDPKDPSDLGYTLHVDIDLNEIDISESNYVPIVHNKLVKMYGSGLEDSEIISQIVNMPVDATAVVTSKPGTSTVGTYNAVVTITLADKSTIDVNVPITIKKKDEQSNIGNQNNTGNQSNTGNQIHTGTSETINNNTYTPVEPDMIPTTQKLPDKEYKKGSEVEVPPTEVPPTEVPPTEVPPVEVPPKNKPKIDKPKKDIPYTGKESRTVLYATIGTIVTTIGGILLYKKIRL